ncbi:MAG: DedA family protein [Patescibacteria group bacterium]
MTDALFLFIQEYGYLAIFLVVFLQELGVPNPVPNEFVLLFSGYLASAGMLEFWPTFFSAFAADFVGTAVLFLVFHAFGHKLLATKTLAARRERIEKLAQSLSTRGWWGIYVGRLVPYLRGYTSVAAGLIQIRPRIFIPLVFFSAVTWSGGYVVIGWALGERWRTAIDSLGGVNAALLALLVLAVALAVFRAWKKRKKRLTAAG